MTNMNKNKFKKIIKELIEKKGRHTELISLYIPSKYPLNEIISLVKQEYALTKNVKSKTVRKNVTDALEKISQQLKLYKTTPKNGLAIFCGNVSEKEGQQDIRLWIIEPPEPIKQRLYWCDQKFSLDNLKSIIVEKDVYGLVVMDRKEVDIAILNGKTINIIKHIESMVPGKTTKGGWSQARYQRIRKELLNNFFKEIAEAMDIEFKDKNLKGILMGGPGMTKESFISGNFLTSETKRKILGTMDTNYTEENGLEELLKKSENILKEAEVIKEKKICDKFFKLLSINSELAIYGIKEVELALEKGIIELLLVSEKMDDTKLEILEKKAKEMSTNIKFISTDTREGIQLFELGGIAGILRYKLY